MGAAVVVAPPSISAATPEPIEPAAIAAARLTLIVENVIRPPVMFGIRRLAHLAPQHMRAATVGRTIMCRPPKFKPARALGTSARSARHLRFAEEIAR